MVFGKIPPEKREGVIRGTLYPIFRGESRRVWEVLGWTLGGSKKGKKTPKNGVFGGVKIGVKKPEKNTFFGLFGPP